MRDAFERSTDGLAVLDVAVDDRHLVLDVVVIRREARDVEEHRVNAVGDEPPGNVGTKEAGAAGDEPAGLRISHEGEPSGRGSF